MSLTLEQARTISDRVRTHATALGVQVSVAVVDSGGHLKVVDRMDGASPLSARVASVKASSVALFRRDGRDLMQFQQSWPAQFAQIDQLAGTPIMAGAGSRLIRCNDAVAGAIAVSGATPDQDDACAEAGLGAISATLGEYETRSELSSR